jgi:hypothetical protein
MVILRSLSFQGVVSQFPPEMQLHLKIRDINKTNFFTFATRTDHESFTS